MPFEPDYSYVPPAEIVSLYGPSDIIRDVVIDRNGIIWMASWDGIMSYDGKQFINHTLKDGLSHHRVYSVFEDSKDNLWFGTLGAGVYRYNGTKFTNLSTNNGLADNTVFDIFEDAKGTMWFATPAGASGYNGASFSNLTAVDSLPGDIYSVSQDKNGVIWLGGESGLFRYDAMSQEKKITPVLTSFGTPYANVRDLYCDNSGAMWIGSPHGLYKLVATDNYQHAEQINAVFTSYVHPTATGDLLLTTGGLLRYNAGKSDTLVHADNRHGIFGAQQDKQGNVWYGAMDGLHAVQGGKDVSYKKR